MGAEAGHSAPQLLLRLSSRSRTASLISPSDAHVHVIHVDGGMDENVVLHHRTVLLSVWSDQGPGNLLIKGSAMKKKSDSRTLVGASPPACLAPTPPSAGPGPSLGPSPGCVALGKGTHLPPESLGVSKFTWKVPGENHLTHL